MADYPTRVSPDGTMERTATSAAEDVRLKYDGWRDKKAPKPAAPQSSKAKTTGGGKGGSSS